jgi:hypothetical protein
MRQEGFAAQTAALSCSHVMSVLIRGGPVLLNRFNNASSPSDEAEVRYLDGDFRVVRPGAFVRCAVTGVAIPLEELKYWSVDRQEAYASPQAVMQRREETSEQG